VADGTTTAEGGDAGEVPTPLTAATSKRYDVPSFSPARAAENDPAAPATVAGTDEVATGVPVQPVAEQPAGGYAARRYEVIVDPWSVGAVQVRTADAAPAIAVTDAGADGAATPARTATDGVEAGDTPTALVAVTTKEYRSPMPRPVTVAVVVVEVTVTLGVPAQSAAVHWSGAKASTV
jgi:hypothetical protein